VVYGLRRQTSTGGYIGRRGPAAGAGPRLQTRDAAGFAAAGVLPWRVVDGRAEVLLALEHRHGVIRLNLVGGKRDTRAETPWATASRELSEESLGLITLDEGSIWAVLWLMPDKFALFVPAVAVEPTTAASFESSWAQSATRPNDTGLVGMLWVPAASLVQSGFLQQQVHGYVAPAMRRLAREGVLSYLQREARAAGRAGAEPRTTRGLRAALRLDL
jgi:hypothetical protein